MNLKIITGGKLLTTSVGRSGGILALVFHSLNSLETKSGFLDRLTLGQVAIAY